MLYTCQICHYTFAKPVEGISRLYCPDCGSACIRKADEEETSRYEREQAENQSQMDSSENDIPGAGR